MILGGGRSRTDDGVGGSQYDHSVASHFARFGAKFIDDGPLIVDAVLTLLLGFEQTHLDRRSFRLLAYVDLHPVRWFGRDWLWGEFKGV